MIMHSPVIFILCVLLYSSVQGVYFKKFASEHENKYYDFDNTSEENENDTSTRFTNSSDEQRLESTSEALSSETTKTSEVNSTFTSSTEPSTKNILSTQSIPVEITLTEIFNNQSNSTSSLLHQSSSTSSTSQTKSGITSLGTSTKEGIILTSTEEEEEEGVVRGQPASTESTNTTISKTESVYQKVLTLINDTYTLSILLPVVAGIVFASTILIIIATCKCLRRQCRRRRLRSKALPDSVKNLRPSDRARLLAESSDEEF